MGYLKYWNVYQGYILTRKEEYVIFPIRRIVKSKKTREKVIRVIKIKVYIVEFADLLISLKARLERYNPS